MKYKNTTFTFSLTTLRGRLKISQGYADIAFAVGIVAIISFFILPIPSWIMNLLLSLSITISVLILMTVLFVNRALDFSLFPSLLLVVTILRLALNIFSTRLILAHGHTGTASAGHVIEAFGLFVMQNSIIVGVIVFGILTIINFVVIAKGFGRMAEVAARFSLDAMPGKQMAIDAGLSAGLIDEKTAKTRRKDLQYQSSFFGARDGANKFVRGDAIAGVLIIIINFVGGIIIVAVQKGMSFEAALQTYTLLTISDGLIAQIPALVVFKSVGLLVTKSGASGSAKKAIFEQLRSFLHALGATSALLFLMPLMLAMPGIPLMVSAIVTSLMAYNTHRTKEEQIDQDASGSLAAENTGAAAAEEAPMSDLLQIDSIKLELGYELLLLINNLKGHKITDQIKALGKQIACDLGFVMPVIRIQDNMQLAPQEYSIKIKDIDGGKGFIKPNKLLVMESKGGQIDIPGEDTKELPFGLPAKWVDEHFKEEALFKNFTVVDSATVITIHLTEAIKDNITELFSHADTQKLMNSLSDEHKELVGDIIPLQITVTVLQRVLEGLLNEDISIRDLPTILEAILEISNSTTNVMGLIEHVRAWLSKQICHFNIAINRYIPFLVLSQKWEQVFHDGLIGNDEARQLSFLPSKIYEFVGAVNREYEIQALKGELDIVFTSPTLRPYISSIIKRFKPSIVVMLQNEIYPKAKIKTIGQI